MNGIFFDSINVELEYLIENNNKLIFNNILSLS